jgi:hypothetical protein
MKFQYGGDYFENFINKWPGEFFLLPILKLYDKEILRFQFSEPVEQAGVGIKY